MICGCRCCQPSQKHLHGAVSARIAAPSSSRPPEYLFEGRRRARGLALDLLAFFADRLKVHLREKGARHDLIDAVFSLGGQDDLALIVKRVEALDAFLKTDDGANLLAGVKRAANILAIEEKKDKKSHAGTYDIKLLVETEETALAAAIEEAKQDTVAAINVESFTGAMNALADLRGPVDAFFEKVTVNATDPKLRENRLRLLSEIRAATLNVADFSQSRDDRRDSDPIIPTSRTSHETRSPPWPARCRTSACST